VAVPRALAMAAGLLVMGGLLSGCVARPGVAATAGGKTISTADLAASLDQLETMLPGSGITSSLALTVLVQEPVYVSVATEHGLGTVTDDQAALALASIPGYQDPHEALTSENLAIGRYVALSTAVSMSPEAGAIQKDLEIALQAQAVTVNPRYGTYDPTTAQVSPVLPPAWLELPAS
jgi:hypothetical protein